MKLLVINIGNTNAQYGVYDGCGIRSVRTVPTVEFLKTGNGILNDFAGIPVAISTVVPAAKKALTAKDIFWVGPTKKLPVSLNRVDSSTLGADRIANIAAVAKSAKLPAIVADFGTAITVDAVNAKKEFLGGAILPGRMLLRKALNNYTAQLPLVEMSGKTPKALGRNTKNAILSGTDLAVIGAVKEIVCRIKREMGVSKCTLMAAGGDAGFFVRNIKGLKSGGKYLTLLGIAACWESEMADSHNSPVAGKRKK